MKCERVVCGAVDKQVRQHDKYHANLWMTKGPRQKEKNPLVLWSLFEEELMQLMHGREDASTPFVVYDPFLKRTYTLKVVLGVVYADTVMRCTMGGFMGVASYRADPYSLFEGTPGPGGKGMYFRGYAVPVKLKGWKTDSGKTEVYADDAELILSKTQHQVLVRKTESGEAAPSATGRRGRGALERLPYYDPMRAIAHPFGHCVLYGVVKAFLKLLLGKMKSNTHPWLSLPKELVDRIQSRAAGIQAPHDVTRPYHDVVKYFGALDPPTPLHAEVSNEVLIITNCSLQLFPCSRQFQSSMCMGAGNVADPYDAPRMKVLELYPPSTCCANKSVKGRVCVEHQVCTPWRIS